MYKRKIVSTIKNIPQKDHQVIARFLESELVLDGKEIKNQRKLFKYLIKYYPALEDKNLAKEKVFKAVYNQPFSNAMLNRLNGRLLTNIKFCINKFGSVKYNELFSSLNECRLYLQNGDENLFQQTLSSIDKSNKKNEPNNDFHLNDYLIERELLNFNYLYNQRKGKLNIKNVSEKLDYFFILKKLELVLSSVAQNTFSYTSDITYILEEYNFLKAYISQKTFDNITIIEMYCQSIEMIQNNDDKAYDKLKKLLKQKNLKLTQNENRNFHTLARNFCVKQYSLGHQDFLKESFECYKHDLNQGFLYHNNGILTSTMQSIVKLGLRMKKFKWVKDFLKDHKNKLTGTREPKAVFNYNMAEYYFYTKKYGKCLDSIEDSLEDLYYKIAAKRLTLKVLFETKSVLLDSRINAFKLFIFRISNDKFTPLHKEGNKQFIDILKQIVNPSTMANNKRKKSISKKINSNRTIADRQWLLDKINEV